MNELIEKLDLSLGIAPTLTQIMQFQLFLENLPKELQLNCEDKTTHVIESGKYSRTLFMQKGEIIIGKMHKFSCMNIISKGKILVYTTEGKKIIDASIAPVIFSSPPGTKRVGYVLEDTYWTTIHDVTTDNLIEIETEIIVPEDEVYQLAGISKGDFICHGPQ